MGKTIVTNDGKKGGWLHGKPHYDKEGNPKGGIKAIVKETDRPVELEGGEVIINKKAAAKNWKTLSKINQSAGNGVPIGPPNNTTKIDNWQYAEGGEVKANDNSIIVPGDVITLETPREGLIEAKILRIAANGMVYFIDQTNNKKKDAPSERIARQFRAFVSKQVGPPEEEKIVTPKVDEPQPVATKKAVVAKKKPAPQNVYQDFSVGDRAYLKDKDSTEVEIISCKLNDTEWKYKAKSIGGGSISIGNYTKDVLVKQLPPKLPTPLPLAAKHTQKPASIDDNQSFPQDKNLKINDYVLYIPVKAKGIIVAIDEENGTKKYTINSSGNIFTNVGISDIILEVDQPVDTFPLATKHAIKNDVKDNSDPPPPGASTTTDLLFEFISKQSNGHKGTIMPNFAFANKINIDFKGVLWSLGKPEEYKVIDAIKQDDFK